MMADLTQRVPPHQNDITPIENVPLRIRVADQLRKGILSGKLPLGSSLVEATLADQLNVSRAPVREAIQILESDGLVETVAYKGKRVKPLTIRGVGEAYSLREIYEVMAVKLILESRVSVDLLHQYCDKMTTAAKANDLAACTEADEGFHHALITLADHDLLLNSWKNLYLRIHQIMTIRNREIRDLTKLAENHPPIVHALEANDADLAIQLITDHTRILAALDPKIIVKGFKS